MLYYLSWDKVHIIGDIKGKLIRIKILKNDVNTQIMHYIITFTILTSGRFDWKKK